MRASGVALAQVESEVRDRIRHGAGDPQRDAAAVRRLVDEVVAGYEDRALGGALPTLGDREHAVAQVWAAVAGYGALQRFLDDPTVEEIWVNEPGKVFVARHG